MAYRLTHEFDGGFTVVTDFCAVNNSDAIKQVDSYCRSLTDQQKREHRLLTLQVYEMGPWQITHGKFATKLLPPFVTRGEDYFHASLPGGRS